MSQIPPSRDFLIETKNQLSDMKPTILDALGLPTKPTKTPWHLRFAGSVNLKEMAATTCLATVLYGLLFAGLLFAPLTPHLAAQSSGTPTITSSTAQLQDGAQPEWVWVILPVLGGTGLRIAWRKWVLGLGGAAAVGVGSNAIYDAATKTWTIPPGATRKGKIRAMGDIWLSKVEKDRVLPRQLRHLLESTNRQENSQLSAQGIQHHLHESTHFLHILRP